MINLVYLVPSFDEKIKIPIFHGFLRDKSERRSIFQIVITNTWFCVKNQNKTKHLKLKIRKIKNIFNNFSYAYVPVKTLMCGSFCKRTLPTIKADNLRNF